MRITNRGTTMNIVTFLALSVGLFVAVEGQTTAVNYTHDGTELQGFLAIPEDATVPIPAVIIIPDWDGVNDYEKTRAEKMASDLGYIGFAADIFGKDKHTVDDMSERIELVNLYRPNATLFSSRIQAAVDTVRAMDMVDGDKIAIAGYCFGGTGVLTYAMTGVNDVQAVVSFHGGLTSVPKTGAFNVTPKLLVLSGGSDDASSDIMELEKNLDSVNADWEITRYSNIEHAFTVWDNAQYNEWADMRSWDSMVDFLKETFGEMPFESTRPDEIDVSNVTYTGVDGTELQAYVAIPSAEYTRPLSAVVILPDWDGNNQYEKERASLLAKAGYVGFAADIFGADLQEGLPIQQRVALTTQYRTNTTLFVQRIEKAISEVKMIDGVDPENIAVIGYCFGGTGIVEFAFSGSENAKAVVSFHGGLTMLPSPETNVTPYTLVLSGGTDDAHGNQTELEAALNGANSDWEITRYSGVRHGFTSWTSPNYSLKADDRSWESMMTSFQQLMPVPTRVLVVPVPTVAPTSVVAVPTSPVVPPTSAEPTSESATPKDLVSGCSSPVFYFAIVLSALLLVWV